MESNIKRRSFLTALGALPLLPLFSALGSEKNKQTEDPHFFIMGYLPGGVDLTHLWDQRDLSLKSSKIRADYVGEEPKIYGGSGVSQNTTKVTSLFDPLKAYQNDFSIIKGVWMSSDFDGHGENQNLLLSGNPFGGKLFLPYFNTNSPLDVLTNFNFPISLSNTNKVVPLNRNTLNTLQERVSRLSPLTTGNPLFEALRKKYASLAQSSQTGSISLGAKLLYSGLLGQSELQDQFNQLGADGSLNSEEELERYLKRIFSLMKLGSTKTAFLNLKASNGLTADTHDSASAKETPALLKSYVAQFVSILKTLKETPYDSTRSFMDVTTFLIGTEFGRTNRQDAADIEKTGTDHNPYNNSFLVGGKNIVGGKVIGGSDLEKENELLSPVHLKIDPNKKMLMGKPYDFILQKIREDLPNALNLDQYITSSSLINTLFSTFNLDKSFWRTNGKSSALASEIKEVLK